MIVPAEDAALAVAYSPADEAVHVYRRTNSQCNKSIKRKGLVTLRVSHLLHSSRGNHDWHRDLEAQHSSSHVDFANINQNPGPKPAYGLNLSSEHH